MSQFNELATDAGFTKEQAEFLEEHLAKYPHTHTVEEIDGLQEVLDEEDEDEDEEEDD